MPTETQRTCTPAPCANRAATFLGRAAAAGSEPSSWAPTPLTRESPKKMRSVGLWESLLSPTAGKSERGAQPSPGSSAPELMQRRLLLLLLPPPPPALLPADWCNSRPSVGPWHCEAFDRKWVTHLSRRSLAWAKPMPVVRTPTAANVRSPSRREGPRVQRQCPHRAPLTSPAPGASPARTHVDVSRQKLRPTQARRAAKLRRPATIAAG
mmetsp:Transcript_127723/g.408904  ORF Transcript_127723/g.408904 Transcript_127723/m.408904 type:complete len:210 (-) Transcript_127723:44-673(-)